MSAGASAEYLKFWSIVFEDLFAHHDVVVDSSKTSRLSFYRPLLLSSFGYSVKLIIVQKKPEQLIASLKKGSNRNLERNESPKRFLLVRATIGWTISMLGCYFVSRKMKQKVSILPLEEFTEDPAPTLTRSLGVDVKAVDELLPLHGVSGNRARRGKALLVLKKEESKEIESNLAERFMARYMSLLTMLLGFDQ